MCAQQLDLRPKLLDPSAEPPDQQPTCRHEAGLDPGPELFCQLPFPSPGPRCGLASATATEKCCSAHTFARPNGGVAWPPLDRPNYVWADGAYMGMALPMRLSRLGHGEQGWVESFIEMHLEGYGVYLRDPSDGLYFHGYNFEARKHSCCKWGRANGWLLLSRNEVLLAADRFSSVRGRRQLVQQQVDHAHAMCTYQNRQSGMIREVVNVTESFDETSVTAMLIHSLATGIMSGWVSRDQFGSCVEAAWRGLSGRIDNRGRVDGICEGGPIYPNMSDYLDRPTRYEASACRGLGAVLSAVVTMQQYQLRYQS